MMATESSSAVRTTNTLLQWMWVLLPLLSLLNRQLPCFSLAFSISFPSSTPLSSSKKLRKAITSTRLWGSFDYEYIPPNPDAESTYVSDLPSAYPKETPAGLRGEAVRSALRSGQCVGWKLNDDSSSLLEHGIVQATGSGTLDFCNNKLTQSFVAPSKSDSSSSTGVVVGNFQEACLLNARGRLIDRLWGVAVTDPEIAYLFTSPGHSANSLFQRLDPFIFPLDQVVLKDLSSSACIFSLSSIRQEHVQSAWENYIWPKLQNHVHSDLPYKLPNKGQCLAIPINIQQDKQQDDSTLNNNNLLLIVPTSGLPDCAVHGYTFCFLGDSATTTLGEEIWQQAVSEENPQGPVAAGAREFESLRIESGQAAYGHELTAHLANTTETPATPLELHLTHLVDTDKGCYLGQEGVAAMLKNPRGPPRTLYQIVFDDEFNIYNHQSKGDKSKIINKTRLPRPGDKLYVLGSNGQIAAGFLTSLAEPSSTGEPATVGLALIRRADSILTQMKDHDLELASFSSTSTASDLEEAGIVDIGDGSGMIAPPPLDPLEGLEVIVGGSFTVGTLRVVPSRRLRNGQILYDDEPDLMSSPADYPSETETSTLQSIEEDKEEDLDKALEEAAKAEAEAEAAAAEAKRKAEKMEMLRKRAEEAMARRKQKK